MGIEPTPVAWEATVLPLNYTRNATTVRLEIGGRQLPSVPLVLKFDGKHGSEMEKWISFKCRLGLKERFR